ncbi:hypothetical protein LSM04_008492 [Trypanosoma melophagium]|uniref:uncharacterized protein n=1 Tax=Trypanosoma melophagium TaxID=715481 RepID=UPI003519F50B|nr:hypothetical protein LSM04_008492 [Trypanosoma melophagium]
MDSLLVLFDDSSEQLNSLHRAALQKEDDGNNQDARMDAFRVLHDAFTAHNDRMISEVDACKTDVEREADDLEEEVAELEEELQMLRNTTEGRVAESNYAAVPPVTLTGTTTSSLSAESEAALEAYQTFITYLADFTSQLSVLRVSLQGILSQSAIQVVSATSLTAWCGVTNRETWTTREKQLHAGWKTVVEKAGAAGVITGDPVLSTAQDLLTQVIQLGKRALSRVTFGIKAREVRENSVKQFETHQRRLVAWCRQQQANLAALSDPDYVQEFCASMLGHFKVMSDNYTALLKTAESLLDNATVQEKLLEANETWVHLQVKTLERLQQTLYEVNENIVLEEHVEEHSSFCLQLGSFIEEVLNSLTAIRDTTSPLHQRSLSLARDCEALRELLPENDDLCKRLIDFAGRMRIQREAYNCYRSAALSRVTYLTSSADIATEAARRKEEFESCVDELQTWADEKSKTDSWRDIRDQIGNIKTLLQREQDLTDPSVRLDSEGEFVLQLWTSRIRYSNESNNLPSLLYTLSLLPQEKTTPLKEEKENVPNASTLPPGWYTDVNDPVLLTYDPYFRSHSAGTEVVAPPLFTAKEGRYYADNALPRCRVGAHSLKLHPPEGLFIKLSENVPVNWMHPHCFVAQRCIHSGEVIAMDVSELSIVEDALVWRFLPPPSSTYIMEKGKHGNKKINTNNKNNYIGKNETFTLFSSSRLASIALQIVLRANSLQKGKAKLIETGYAQFISSLIISYGDLELLPTDSDVKKNLMHLELCNKSPFIVRSKALYRSQIAEEFVES